MAIAVLTLVGTASRDAYAADEPDGPDGHDQAEKPDEPDKPAGPGPATPSAKPTDEKLERLEKALEAQQRQIAELQTRVDEKERAPAPVPSGPPLVVVSGFVHVDWTLMRQSSEDEVDASTREPLNEDRFVLRRGRIRIDTDQGLVHGTLTLDANTIHGPQVRPWNAEVSVKWPQTTTYRGPAAIQDVGSESPFVMVSAGLLTTPFGFDVAELEATRPFLERTTMANELVPQSFDLGLRVLGGYKFFNYALGIMNGDPIGDRTFPGRDPNKSKDLVFRLGVAPAIGEHVRLAVGLSGLTGRGFHEGTAPTKDQLVWRDQNEDGIVQQTELQSIAGSPATPSEGFDRFAMGADARLHVAVPALGELVLRGEIVRAKNLDRGLFAADPVAASRDLREFGWYVGATQEITRWAMIGVRYDVYDPDADASEQRAFALVPKDSSLSTWSFMAMARWKTARLVAEYDKRTNALGRDVSGAPTTLADDSFTLRAAVAF